MSAQPFDDGDPFDFPVESAQEAGPRYLQGDGKPIPAAFRKPAGPVFMDADWDDEEPEVVPCIFDVEGGRPLFYDGESHMIYGESGSGKSWLGALVCAQVARALGVAAVIDYESNRRTWRLRLKALGVTKAEASRIAYWHVTESLMPGQASRRGLDAWIAAHKPTFILLDSVAKSMGAAGMDESNPGQYVVWQQQVVEPWTSLRITSLIIDHIGHINEEKRRAGRTPAARGASSKKDQVTGASYYFEADAPWSRTNDGHGLLSRMKDREGWGRTGALAAEVIVTVADLGAQVSIRLVAPAEQGPKPKLVPRYTWYMQDVCRLVATDLLWTETRLVAHYDADPKRKKAYAKPALDALIAEGYVVKAAPALRGACYLSVVRGYTEADDPAVAAAVAAAV